MVQEARKSNILPELYYKFTNLNTEKEIKPATRDSLLVCMEAMQTSKSFVESSEEFRKDQLHRLFAYKLKRECRFHNIVLDFDYDTPWHKRTQYRICYEKITGVYLVDPEFHPTRILELCCIKIILKTIKEYADITGKNFEKLVDLLIIDDNKIDRKGKVSTKEIKARFYFDLIQGTFEQQVTFLCALNLLSINKLGLALIFLKNPLEFRKTNPLEYCPYIKTTAEDLGLIVVSEL